ncbi:hypothetical protein ACWEKR_03770 [Nocardia sp. NPDC004573]
MNDIPLVTVPPFSVLATGIVADPVAVARRSRCVDVVVLGAEHDLLHLVIENDTIVATAHVAVPSRPVGRPTLVSWGADRLDLFIRDAETRLWHCEYTGCWGMWRLVRSEGAVSDASAVSWSRGRFDLFATGAAGMLEHYWYQHPIGLMGPESLAGQVVGQPAAVVTSLYGVEVVARGSDDGVLRRQFHVPEERAHEWTSTPMLPGRATFDIGPAVAAATGEPLSCTGDPTMVWCRGLGSTENRLVAFARHHDQLLQLEPRAERLWRTGHCDKVLTAPPALSDPVAVAASPCRIDAFFGVSAGTVGWVTTRILDAGASSTVVQVVTDGIASVGRPAVCSGRPGRLDIFVCTVDGDLRYGWCELNEEHWNARS